MPGLFFQCKIYTWMCAQVLKPCALPVYMLYIVLAYLMLFAALTNAVYLHNASFFAIDFCKCFLFSCFVFVYFIFVICIMHSAFNLFVFPNSMFTSLLLFFFLFFFL